MADSIGTAILAAGKGTRLKIDRAKVLMPVLGLPLVEYTVNEIKSFFKNSSLKGEIGVVIGHQGETVKQALKHQSVQFAEQREQKGTADALKSYFHDLPQMWNHQYTLIACGDTPLMTANDFSLLLNEIKKDPQTQAVVATFQARDPKGYGRVKRVGKGIKIIEEKDASDEERKITEVNSALYLIKTEHIKKNLDKIGNQNKSGEFYLTDLFTPEIQVSTVIMAEENFMGVNTLVQLEEVARIMQKRKIQELQLSGVNFLNSSSCYVEWKVKVAPNCTIFPQVHLMGNTQIESGVIIESGCIIKNSQIKSQAQIFAYSYLEDAIVCELAQIGPFARLRTGSEIGAQAKIGNFVETKNAKLAESVKVSHLSYVGDAEIGARTNIGCGFITCNYDGAKKHKTIIGKDSFIGSDCQMIAPIEIGDRAYVGSGSTINKPVPSDAFAIARARQETKEEMAKRFIKVKKDS